jgi:hypothetical protein
LNKQAKPLQSNLPGIPPDLSKSQIICISHKKGTVKGTVRLPKKINGRTKVKAPKGKKKVAFSGGFFTF